jgi:hypothetical protein
VVLTRTPREIVVGDEGVEALAVPVDTQPGHVPAGVVGVADAEQREGRDPDRIAGSPVEAERAALGVDVARRHPTERRLAGRLEIGAVGRVGLDLDLVGEVGGGLAAGDVGIQALIASQAEEQAVIALLVWGGVGEGGQGGQRG